MAKVLSLWDLGDNSPLTNLYATPTTKRQREWGAFEYDDTLELDVASAKVLTPYDLGANSQLINRAGTNPTTTDARGVTVLGAQREWGAFEYNSAIDYVSSPKLLSMYDLSGYSQLVNYEKPTSSAFLPTTTDARGITVRLNAKFSHNVDRYFPTTTDARDTEVLGGFREFGAFEFDDSLRADDSVPTAEQNAQAVWDFLTASADESGSFGLYIQDNIVPAATIADAVWDETTSGHTTTGTFGKFVQKLLTVAKFIGLK